MDVRLGPAGDGGVDCGVRASGVSRQSSVVSRQNDEPLLVAQASDEPVQDAADFICLFKKESRRFRLHETETLRDLEMRLYFTK
jgi:hypothetical protein